MTANEQILGVLAVIRHARDVNPEGAVVTIAREGFNPYPDFATILQKLDSEYKAISIERLPELSDVDYSASVGFYSDEVLQRGVSYSIAILESFDLVYREFEQKSSPTITPVKPILPKATTRVERFAIREDGTITFDDKPVPLEPKQQRVAVALLENYPSIVSFDSLIEVYWNDSNEHEAQYLDTKERSELVKNLHDCTSKMRKAFALLDQKDHIRSSPRIGYRFLA